MNQREPGTDEFDPFLAQELFPEAGSIFSWQPAPLDEVIKTCLIVLDTTVLMLPYNIGSRSLAEIGRVYRTLAREGRLIVPGQAAREFARTRATKLTEIRKHLKAGQAKRGGGEPY